MLAEHERLLLNRDRVNSKPSAFLTVDSRIQNSNGSSRPWFRAVGRDFVDSISEEIDEQNHSLDHLVKDRADVIASLGNATVQTRAAQRRGHETAEVDQDHKMHREHVVRDGYEMQVAPTLHSLPDGYRQMTNLENRVLYAMNVPPVAVGRNVNSERMASAPQLVMFSLRSYKSLIARIRGLLEEMFKAVADKDGAYLRFGPHVDNYDLDRIESIMTPDAAVNAYAATFGIPRDWLSKEAITARQGALHGEQRAPAAEAAAGRQAKRARGPPPGATDTA